MDKQIYIRNYLDQKKSIIVRDFENVVDLTVSIISGDEVLTVTYADGHSEKFDSSDDRIMDFFDGCYTVPLNRVDEFSNFKGDSYDCMDFFDGDVC